MEMSQFHLGLHVISRNLLENIQLLVAHQVREVQDQIALRMSDKCDEGCVDGSVVEVLVANSLEVILG